MKMLEFQLGAVHKVHHITDIRWQKGEVSEKVTDDQVPTLNKIGKMDKENGYPCSCVTSHLHLIFFECMMIIDIHV